VAIDSVLNLESAASERDRNRLLLEIGKAVTSNLSLGDLLRTVSSSLRQFIKHDFASVVLSDEDTGQLRVHGLDTPVTGPFAEGTVLPIDGTPVGLAIKTRKTLVRDRIDFEEFYAPQIRVAYSGGLRSGICVPLISHGNVLGGLNIGSTREAAFTADDVKILEEIAGQVAIGVENALNFQRAERERDRKQTLLEINNAISTHLDLADLLRVTSERLRDYFEHDLAGLVLYNQDTDQLVAHTLDLSRDNSTLVEGAPFPIDGTLNGLAFSTRKPVVRHRIDPTETSWALARQFFEEQGLKSYYWMPLVTGGRAVGVLNIGSRKENALSDRDVELLQHIATQIAIAVENSLVYQEITALKNKLASEKLYLEEEIRTEHNFSEIVGESATLKRILQQVATVAPTDSAVLLCGETGTGKELIARAIHDLSSRKERTLVKLNCAAIPTGLLESELFGHEKGAFTGAIAARIGRFELAHKGTLLLDEIGEIPLELQPKLLRVLQEQEFERLGSSRTVKTDVRLIAATNVDLPQMVTEKKFRSDLYYRLNVFPITIPPLRERIGDIPLLVGYFTQKHALRMNKRIHMVAKETIDSLCQYSWPGNVRELENFIERAVILTSGSELQAPLSELSAQVLLNADGHGSATAPAAPTAQPVTMEDVERAHIEEILQRTRGVIGGKGGAAEILGLPISTLRNRMKKLGLK
jgi:formate hydrogenlyase transcriptional activator